METNRYQSGLDKLMEFTVTENTETSTYFKISESFKDITLDVSIS